MEGSWSGSAALLSAFVGAALVPRYLGTLRLKAGSYYRRSGLGRDEAVYLLVSVAALAFLLISRHFNFNIPDVAAGAYFVVVGLAIRFVIADAWRVLPKLAVDWRFAQVLTSVRRELRPRPPDHLHNFSHIRLSDTFILGLCNALPIRGPRRYGLALTVGGMYFALTGLISAAVVVFVGLAFLGFTVGRHENQEIARSQATNGHEADQILHMRKMARAVVPLSAANYVLVLIGLTIYAYGTILTRSAAVTSVQDGGTAVTLLLALAGVQLTWGIFTLSAWLIVIQMVSGTYGARVSRAVLFHKPLVLALSLAFASAGFDFLTAARVQDWFFEHPVRGSMLLDNALLTAVVSLAALIGASISAFSVLSPSHLSTIAQHRFDSSWRSSVARDWPRYATYSVSFDEPSQDLQEFLRSSVARGDIETAHTTIVTFKTRLLELGCAKDWLSVDAYLEDKMGELISMSSRTYERLASAWIDLAGDLGSDWIRPETLRRIERSAIFDGRPPGARVLVRATLSSLDADHQDAPTWGIRALGETVQAALKHLPADEDTVDFHPDAEHWKHLDARERKHLYRNQDPIRLVESQLILAFERIFDRAVAATSIWPAEFTAFITSGLVAHVIEATKGRPNIRAVLAASIMFRIEAMASRVARSWDQKVESLPSFGLDDALRALDVTNESDLRLFRAVVNCGLRVCQTYLQFGRTDYLIAHEAQRLGLQAIRDDHESGEKVVDFLASVLRLKESSLEIEKLQREVESVLRQLRWHANEATTARIDALLDEGRATEAGA